MRAFFALFASWTRVAAVTAVPLGALYSSWNRKWVSISSTCICTCSLSALCKVAVRFTATKIAHVLRSGHCVVLAVVLTSVCEIAHGVVFSCYKWKPDIFQTFISTVFSADSIRRIFLNEQYTVFGESLKLTETVKPGPKDSRPAAGCVCWGAVHGHSISQAGVHVANAPCDLASTPVLY